MKLQSELGDERTDPVTEVAMDSESSGIVLDAQWCEDSRVLLTSSPQAPSPRANVPAIAAGADSGDEEEGGVGARKPRGCRVILQESDSDGEEGALSTNHPDAGVTSGSDEDAREEENNRRRPRRIRVALDSAEESGAEGSRAEGRGADGGFARCSASGPGELQEEDHPGLSSPESPADTGKQASRDTVASDHRRERKRSWFPGEGESSDEDDPFTHKFGVSGDLGEVRSNDEGEEEEEEESLEAIKSSMKKKAQKSRAVSGAHHDNDGDDEEEAFLKQSKQKKGRVERKAAQAGRAAIQQLHSESQRIIRESNMSLPYHLPEPRSIHEFFKRRTLPAGDAMSLLKSTKYQPGLLSVQDVPQSSSTSEPSTVVPGDAHDPHAEISAGARGEVGEAAAADTTVIRHTITSEGDEAGMPREAETSAAPGSELPPPHPVGEDGNLDRAENPNKAENPHGMTSLEGRMKASAGEDRHPAEPVQPCEDRETSYPDTVVSHEVTATDTPTVAAVPKLASALMSPQSRTRARLQRLQGLGVDLSVRPTLLRAAPGAFIDLEEPALNPGLNDLKERFLKHATGNLPVRPRGPVKIHVNCKEMDADGNPQLLQEVLTVTVGDAIEKPGAKLLSLKAQLQEAMRLRRMEERQKRMEAYELDNEEGFQEEEDGDEELTDEESDTGSEGPNDDGPEQEEEEKVDDEDDKTSSSKDENCKAAHLGLSEATLELFDHTTDTRSEQAAGRAHTHTQLKSCSDDELYEGSSLHASLHKDESHNSSLELQAFIPPYQHPRRTPSAPAQRTPSPALFSPMSQFGPTHFSSYPTITSSKLSETSRRTDDLEDLYHPASPERPGSPTSLPTDSEFRFSLGDESQSQLLDADGYLNVGRSKVHKTTSAKRKLNLLSLEENAMHSDMDELVGMCSGKFESQNPMARNGNNSNMDELVSLCSGKFESLDSMSREGKNSDMDELVGLCSGKFESQVPMPRENSDMDELIGLCSGKFESQVPMSKVRVNSDMDELLGLCSGKFESQDPTAKVASQDEGGTGGVTARCTDDHSAQARPKHIGEDEDKGVFDILTDDEALSEEENKGGRDSSDAGSDEEENEDEDVNEDDEDGGDDVTSVAANHEDSDGRMKKRARISHFLEEEAELSGSEAGSDEDFSGNEEDNEYEEEDIQEQLPSEDELHDQVKRLHMKALLDEDKRKLRLYQEVLLPDGDLHSDGPGRRRTFRWKHLDDSTQTDLFPRDEDDEEDGEAVGEHDGEEQDGEQEVQRRKERFEREKWMREKGKDSADEDDVGEDSQFLKLAKKITAKSRQTQSHPLPAAQPAEGSMTEKAKLLQPKSGSAPVRLGPRFSLPQVKSGSFLNKPKELLEKLASLAEPSVGAARGASRNFVFHTVSPSAGRGPKPTFQERKPQVRRSLADDPSSQPSPKRARTAKHPRSVFRFLND